jgi:hypothetical protein
MVHVGEHFGTTWALSEKKRRKGIEWRRNESEKELMNG